ncbi:MAG TPA: CPBP family intramembrane glutamic endopeptidase [Kofleriaceae bacterium]|nr:CPBP family intramembrane glutamic endopeptidase [Kofleriaceae bacterium]
MNGLVCSVCGAPLKEAARFCGRCGAEQGLMIARDAGAGPELREPRAPMPPLTMRGLGVALVVYFVALAPMLFLFARGGMPSLGELDMIEWLAGVAGLIGIVALGREGLRGLGVPRVSISGAAIALGATAIVVALVELLSQAFPRVFFDEALYLRAWYGLGFAGAILHVAVIPAITEELAFRGAVLPGLRGLLGDRTAIAVAAMLFAILHLSVPSLVHLTLLGAILGAVRVKSGSVWPCVLIHAGYNAAVIALHW